MAQSNPIRSASRFDALYTRDAAADPATQGMREAKFGAHCVKAANLDG